MIYFILCSSLAHYYLMMLQSSMQGIFHYSQDQANRVKPEEAPLM